MHTWFIARWRFKKTKKKKQTMYCEKVETTPAKKKQNSEYLMYNEKLI